MIKTHAKKVMLLARRRRRIKSKMDRFSGKLRLVVIRSSKHISGQLINDIAGNTLVAASSMEKGFADALKKCKSKVEIAQFIGQELGKRAAEKKVSKIVFDRNGYAYHGRVKAFADGVRESGIKF